MNVLLVCTWDNLGGVCSVVNQVALHLRARGHGVYMLHPGDSIAPRHAVSRKGLPAFQMNLRPTSRHGGQFISRVGFLGALPYTLATLGSLLSERKIDVVNIHYPTSSKIYFAILRKLGVCKLVTSIHGADLLPNGARVKTQQFGIRAVLAASDLIVTPSESYRQAVLAAWPELRHLRIETIPNGVDPRELGYADEARDSASDPPYILSILNLVKYKGVDILIRAFAEIASEFPTLRLKLISDGPDRHEFERLARDLGLADRIEFLGFLEKPLVAAYLRGCTLFALPSRSNSESFGIAAAEAMAVDKPVVGSRIGGLPEIIEHEVTGLLVPPADVSALASALRRLLNERETRNRLGRAAGERVRRDFPWSRTSQLYEQKLLGVVGETASASTSENVDAPPARSPRSSIPS